MFGMEQMMKEMLGIDPSEIKEQVAQAVQQANEVITEFRDRENLILHKLTRVEGMLEILVKKAQENDSQE